jgi:putative DNA primase/helicase
LTNVLGENNVANVSFSSLSKECFILDLVGKMANISSETPHKRQMDTDIIKAVVAGDLVSGRLLYKNPVKFRPFAKHYLAMNELPIIEDPSHGMWRRIYIIEFPRIFSEEEEDKDLTRKLEKEASGILNWALEGLERLQKRNFIFPKVRSIETAKQTYQKESNSVLEFMDECIFKSDSMDERIKFSFLYQKYLEYCRLYGYRIPEKKNDFKRILQKQGIMIERSSRDANQVFAFGVMLAPDQDYQSIIY